MDDNRWIDPLKEAAKQYYRDNPDKAVEDTAEAYRFSGTILLMIFVGGLIARWIGLDSDTSFYLVGGITICYVFRTFWKLMFA